MEENQAVRRRERSRSIPRRLDDCDESASFGYREKELEPDYTFKSRRRSTNIKPAQPKSGKASPRVAKRPRGRPPQDPGLFERLSTTVDPETLRRLEVLELSLSDVVASLAKETEQNGHA